MFRLHFNRNRMDNSILCLAGTSRCDVPARVDRVELTLQERPTTPVVPLYTTRTAQRAVPLPVKTLRRPQIAGLEAAAIHDDLLQHDARVNHPNF